MTQVPGAGTPTFEATTATTGPASVSPAPTGALPTAASATERPMPTAAPTLAPTPVPTPTLPADPAIGIPIRIGDQQLMTVVAAEQWPGTSSLKPRSGKVFFTVSIRVDAILLTSFDSADFRLRDAAGKTYGWRTGRSPHLYDLANMSPGNYYVGWITYEVPKSVVTDLTLVYRPSFLGGTTFEVPLT